MRNLQRLRLSSDTPSVMDELQQAVAMKKLQELRSAKVRDVCSGLKLLLPERQYRCVHTLEECRRNPEIAVLKVDISN